MDLEKRLLWGMKVVDEDGDANPNAKVDFERLNMLQKVSKQCIAATEATGTCFTKWATIGRANHDCNAVPLPLRRRWRCSRTRSQRRRDRTSVACSGCARQAQR